MMKMNSPKTDRPHDRVEYRDHIMRTEPAYEKACYENKDFPDLTFKGRVIEVNSEIMVLHKMNAQKKEINNSLGLPEVLVHRALRLLWRALIHLTGKAR